jgi:hypothetical protein
MCAVHIACIQVFLTVIGYRFAKIRPGGQCSVYTQSNGGLTLNI